MKKFLFVFLAIALVYSLAVNKNGNTQITKTIDNQAYKTYVLADTTSLTTYKTMLTVPGPCKVYRILFNNSSASYDPSVIVNFDGYLDTLTEASNEEVTRFITRIRTPSENGNDQYLAAGDSTQAGGVDLNLECRTGMTIKAKSENASGITRVTVIYGKLQ